MGVNARDLTTLAVDPNRFATLAHSIPNDRIVIAESGVHTPTDIQHVADLGFRGALVGTALMRTDRPAGLVRDMVEAGNRGVTRCA